MLFTHTDRSCKCYSLTHTKRIRLSSPNHSDNKGAGKRSQQWSIQGWFHHAAAGRLFLLEILKTGQSLR